MKTELYQTIKRQIDQALTEIEADETGRNKFELRDDVRGRGHSFTVFAWALFSRTAVWYDWKLARGRFKDTRLTADNYFNRVLAQLLRDIAY